MKRLMIAVAFVLAACAQEASVPDAVPNGPPDLDSLMLPLTDQAGNRMEALTQTNSNWCSPDALWCVNSDGETASVSNGEDEIILPVSGDVWPMLIRGTDLVLIGIIATDQTPYSGGNAAAQHLTLFQIAGGAAREVARLPYSGDAMIRACFDEADQTARAGACHDEYKFVTRIFIDETVSAGAPTLVLETEAGSYPGAVSRTTDSGERGPLTEADLLWARDDMCSFRRTYTRGADNLYAPDQPLPGCADYLEP